MHFIIFKIIVNRLAEFYNRLAVFALIIVWRCLIVAWRCLHHFQHRCYITLSPTEAESNTDYWLSVDVDNPIGLIYTFRQRKGRVASTSSHPPTSDRELVDDEETETDTNDERRCSKRARANSSDNHDNIQHDEEQQEQPPPRDYLDDSIVDRVASRLEVRIADKVSESVFTKLKGFMEECFKNPQNKESRFVSKFTFGTKDRFELISNHYTKFRSMPEDTTVKMRGVEGFNVPQSFFIKVEDPSVETDGQVSISI